MHSKAALVDLASCKRVKMAARRTQTFSLEEARDLLFDDDFLQTLDITQSDIEVDPDYSDVSTSFSYFV